MSLHCPCPFSRWLCFFPSWFLGLCLFLIFDVWVGNCFSVFGESLRLAYSLSLCCLRLVVSVSFPCSLYFFWLREFIEICGLRPSLHRFPFYGMTFYAWSVIFGVTSFLLLALLPLQIFFSSGGGFEILFIRFDAVLFLPGDSVSLCCSATSRIFFNWFRCEVLVLGAQVCWWCLFAIVNFRARHSLALHRSCALCPPASSWQPCWTKLSCNFVRPTPTHIFYGAGLACPLCFFLHPVTAMVDVLSALLSGCLIHLSFFRLPVPASRSAFIRCILGTILPALFCPKFYFHPFQQLLVIYLVLWPPLALFVLSSSLLNSTFLVNLASFFFS